MSEVDFDEVRKVLKPVFEQMEAQRKENGNGTSDD